ncbi:MAG: hypothetical protein IJ941_04170, partial [Clostridia bacterium]|nr:hypothetical protein [Clostridia bacterium]
MGGLLVCAALFFLGRSFFPSILKTILTIAAIGMLLIVAIIPERCGLSWKDKLTVLAPDIPIQRGMEYIEVEIDKTI